MTHLLGMAIKLQKICTCPPRYESPLNFKSFFHERKTIPDANEVVSWHLSSHKTNANKYLTPPNMHVCLRKSSGWRDKVNCNKRFKSTFTVVMASEFFCSDILLFCFEVKRNLKHFLTKCNEWKWKMVEAFKKIKIR